MRHLLVQELQNERYRSRLEEIIEGLELIKKEFGLPIIFPVHPRTLVVKGGDRHEQDIASGMYSKRDQGFCRVFAGEGGKEET
jgi:hypothetical protein